MTYPASPGNFGDPLLSPSTPPSYPSSTDPLSSQPGDSAGQSSSAFGDPSTPPSASPSYPSSTDPLSSQPGAMTPVQPYGSPGGYVVSDPYAASYAAPPRPTSTNGLAIASLVLGVMSVSGLCAYGLGGYLGVAAAILGHISRRQIRRRQQEGRHESGSGMAVAGIIMGWIATAISALITLALVVLIIITANHASNY
ncbi:MAG TPA: DUF4190 domain-containing protein [Micromonospora sp.]